MRDRAIYQRLLAELEQATRHIEKINTTIHELIDEWDAQEAERIDQEHKKWMEGDDA